MRKGIWLLAIFVLAALAPLSAAPTIQRGVDTFTTPADGNTFYDFARQPIPAGFFCQKSEPFTGRVALKGLPLATSGAQQLHGADTVIERLGDATFDSRGRATTQIRFKALSLVSISPIETACGPFHVYVSLAGRQRQTVMRLARTNEKSGTFEAPLAVNARMLFVPVERQAVDKGRKLELRGSFNFPATPLPWQLTSQARPERSASLLVDTDGDQRPDSVIVKTPGFSAVGAMPSVFEKIRSDCYNCQSCHTDPASAKQHCTGINVVVCPPQPCPAAGPAEL